MTRRQWIGAAAVVVAFWIGGTAATFAADQCYTCHSSLGDKPSKLFVGDVHRAHGLTCAGCHGGDPATDDMTVAMDTARGFIGVPKGDAVSAACARCHSDSTRMKEFGVPVDQFERLRAGAHGKALAKDGNHLLQCTTCHGAHGIVQVKSATSPVSPLKVVATCSSCHADAALMRQYNPSLPVDQREKYRTSMHGMRNAKGDAKVAQCVSCHGSHDILGAADATSRVYPVNIPQTCSHCHSDSAYMAEYGIPTNQYAQYAGSVHGVALLQRHDVGAPACNSCHGNHGAAPPGVESISNVCGTCHALNAELFEASPHKKAFDQRKLPECETCHGKHEIIAATNRLLGVSPDAVCTRCHTASTSMKGYDVAGVMRSMVDSLDMLEQQSRAAVNEAEQKGMEVGEAQYKLRDVHQARLKARTVIHSLDEGKFREVVEGGMHTATTVHAEAVEAIYEFAFRRVGLGIATLIITTLAVALYLLIRRIEGK